MALRCCDLGCFVVVAFAVVVLSHDMVASAFAGNPSSPFPLSLSLSLFVGSRWVEMVRKVFCASWGHSGLENLDVHFTAVMYNIGFHRCMFSDHVAGTVGAVMKRLK